MFKIVVSTIVLLLTTGCASFIGEGKQTVSVQAVCYGRSMPAQCVAENGRGRTRFFEKLGSDPNCSHCVLSHISQPCSREAPSA
jgi:hypothetical protein